MTQEFHDVSQYVNKYRVNDRVRVKFGVNRGCYGTIKTVTGDNGTYYGVKLDTWHTEIGFSEYELEYAR